MSRHESEPHRSLLSGHRRKPVPAAVDSHRLRSGKLCTWHGTAGARKNCGAHTSMAGRRMLLERSYRRIFEDPVPTTTFPGVVPAGMRRGRPCAVDMAGRGLQTGGAVARASAELTLRLSSPGSQATVVTHGLSCKGSMQCVVLDDYTASDGTELMLSKPRQSVRGRQRQTGCDRERG